MDCSSTSLTMLAKFGFYLNYHFSTVPHWERNCKSDKARITTSVLPGKSRGLITRIAMMVKLTKGRTSKTTLRILLFLLCSKYVLQSWGSLVPIQQICNFFWHNRFDIQGHDSLLIYHVIVSLSISFLSCGFNMEFYFHLAWRPLRGPLARPLAQMGWFGLTGRTTSWLNRTHRNA